jgi:ABC-type antimicrobial peptide transport system permease subunit
MKEYGLVSFFAASRVREVGIRIALGAPRGSIAGLVVFQGIRLVVIGAAVGVLGSILMGRLLKDLLFGVRPFDMGTLLITILVLGIATVLAALIPAWRSARLQPMQACAPNERNEWRTNEAGPAFFWTMGVTALRAAMG